MMTLEEEHQRAETKRRKRQSTRFTTIVKQNIVRVRGRQSAQKKRKVCDSDGDEDLIKEDDLRAVCRFGADGDVAGARKYGPPRLSKKEVFLTRLLNEKKRQLPHLTGKWTIHERRALQDEILTLQRELDDLLLLKLQALSGDILDHADGDTTPGAAGLGTAIERSDRCKVEDVLDAEACQDATINHETTFDHDVVLASEGVLDSEGTFEGEGAFGEPLGSVPVDALDVDTCLSCNRRLLHKQADARLVCPQCGVSVDYAPSTNAGVAFGEDVEISVHAYERVKHFKTNLQQFSVEAPAIPADVVERVHKGYARLHVKSVHEVRATPVKEVLKSLNLSEWRNFSSRITNLMNGVPSALFTPDEIKEMLQMFMEIQPIFASVKTRVRKNFLNTNYLLNKFCRIKGWPQRAQCFSLMKDGAVLQKQDCTFKRMCRKKGWKFFSSI